jgi:hypothetical protein
MKTLCLLIALAAVACVPQRDSVLVVEQSPMGVLRVEAPVKDALIYVDDFFAGTVGGAGQRGIRVQAGIRRVEVRHERYHSHYQVVTITKDQTTLVKAVLREVLE